jgi:hypothetical protein
LGELLPSAATLLRQLKNTGELVITQELSPPWLTVLANSLKLDSTLRVSLAGAHAVEWQAALIAQGIRASRLQLVEGTAAGLQLKVLGN